MRKKSGRTIRINAVSSILEIHESIPEEKIIVRLKQILNGYGKAYDAYYWDKKEKRGIKSPFLTVTTSVENEEN